MLHTRSRIAVTLFAIVALGCRGPAHEDGPCEELLECCASLGEVARASCEESYDRYHELDGAAERCAEALDAIRAAGQCGDSGGGGGVDAGVEPEVDARVEPPASSVELTIESYNDDSRGARIHIVNGSTLDIPVTPEQFSLTLEDRTVLSGSGNNLSFPCDVTLAPGGSRSCAIGFWEPGLARSPGVTITYRHLSLVASAEVDASGECAGRDENDAAACNDGCDNDLDGFVDCEDRDCCDYVGGCGAETYCGRNPRWYESSLGACTDGIDNDEDGQIDCQDYECCVWRNDCPTGTECYRACVLGPEDTWATCTDGCNNDGDDPEWVDCDDRDCCAAIAAGSGFCEATTYCGS